MKTYLDLYYEWMEAGEMPDKGLCGSLCWDDNLNLFTPTSNEYGSSDFSSTTVWYYWGATGDYHSTERPHSMAFTPFRQTVLLLMAAMNGEL